VEFRPRSEAVYVSGRGVSGVIARVADIEITGDVGWSEQQAAEEAANADYLGALREPVW
jgi:hypothetical protein